MELGGRYEYREEEYEQAPGWNGVLPGNKRRATLTLEATAESFRYARDTFLSLMGPVEDLRLGLRATLRGGAALEALGSDRSYPVLGTTLRWFTGRPGQGYLLAEAEVNTRVVEERLSNTVLLSSLRAYGRLPGNGLLAWRGQFTLLDEMEDPQQLLLDSPNGLRGYEANSRDGDRRLLTNLEWRQPLWFPGWMTLGGVLFADGGIIWDESRPIESQPFLVGAGAGLRMGFSGLLGAPVVRLDVAYGFQSESVESSFGFDQRF
jgi:hypothetical protein